MTNPQKVVNATADPRGLPSRATDLPSTTPEDTHEGIRKTLAVLKRQHTITIKKLENIDQVLGQLEAAVVEEKCGDTLPPDTWWKRLLDRLWPKQRANSNE